MPQSLSSEMLAKIIDGSSIASFVINNEHIIIQWNTAIEALTGLNREEVTGTDGQWKPFYSQKRPVLADLIIDGATPEEIELYYGSKCRKSHLIEGAYEVEDFFPAIGKDGRWLHITASPIRKNGQVIGAIATYEDVTERKIAEENLRRYLKEITNAREKERKRISRELHDNTIQLLGSLSRQLDNFIRKNRSLAADDISTLKGIQDQLNRGVQDLHRFCQGLRLSVLDDLGLVPALRSLIKGLQESAGIKAELNVLGELKRCPPDVESMLFGIVQEAVNNIRKHAQASRAHVIIRFTEEGITITVHDNGRGFKLEEKVEELPRTGKLGLAGIQELARLLAGTFEIKSAPGKGTTLSIKIPPA